MSLSLSQLRNNHNSPLKKAKFQGLRHPTRRLQLSLPGNSRSKNLDLRVLYLWGKKYIYISLYTVSLGKPSFWEFWGRWRFLSFSLGLWTIAREHQMLSSMMICHDKRNLDSWCSLVRWWGICWLRTEAKPMGDIWKRKSKLIVYCKKRVGIQDKSGLGGSFSA